VNLTELFNFLSNLNGWSVLGLAIVCATYAYTQRTRERHHDKRLAFIAHPARTPEQLAALAGYPLPPPVKEPSSGKLAALMLLLFTSALAYRAGEGVVLARLQQAVPTGLFAQKKSPIGDFQADLRPDGLPVGTLVSR
jgi:hypothetical protein